MSLPTLQGLAITLILLLGVLSYHVFSEFCLGLLKKCQQKRRNIENEEANFVDFPAINHTCSEIEGRPNHDRPHVINEPCLS